MIRLSKDSTKPEFQNALDFFSDAVSLFKQRLAQLESEISPNAIPEPGDAFHKRMQEALEDSVTACRNFEESHADAPELILEIQQAFRDAIGPWFKQSWFAHRAWTKPSGFSGDYQMLLKLYERSTPARGLGAYIDLCLSDLQLSNAVRARMTMAREFLLKEIASREGDVRILDMACGPCREFENWPEFKGRRIEVVAMDNDPAALEYVGSTVASQLPPSATIQPVRYNALRTRNAEATKKNFGSFDIIYSVGLCDYLTDEHLIGIFSGLGETLNEGGKMVIAFKDTEHYDKTPYQWHLDWFFYQRTVDDVLDVYERSGFNTSKMVLTRDTTGIITNFESRRAPDTIRRLDPAQLPKGARTRRAAEKASEERQPN